MTTRGIIIVATAVTLGVVVVRKALNTPPLDLLRDDILVLFRLKTSEGALLERQTRDFDQEEREHPGIHDLYLRRRDIFGNIGVSPAERTASHTRS